jgi:hypothetical protein
MTAAVVDSRPPNRLLYAGIAALMAVSVGVQVVRDRGWAPYSPPNPTLWLQSGAFADKLFLGYKNLVADVYWMRAVVYYGGKRREAADRQESGAPANTSFDSLYPLLDLVTTLDPRFKVAYRFGAIFLTEAYPAGPGRPDLAIALLQRGIERDAARWEYMEDIGFVYYWWVKDFTKAAEWFKRAGEQQGAPSWLAPLAATTLAQGGDRQASRFLWTQMLQTTDIEWIKNNANIRLKQLDAMDLIDELNRRVAIYVASQQRPPADWREFAAATGIRGVPVDPTGVPFVLDERTGTVDIDPKSSLWPLPR